MFAPEIGVEAGNFIMERNDNTVDPIFMSGRNQLGCILGLNKQKIREPLF